MTFAEKLNEYMRAFFCTPKTLVKLSGVSAATISRYRAGSREPAADSAIFDSLVEGLSRAALEAQRTDVTPEQLRRELRAVLSDDSDSYDTGSMRISLDMLIRKLHLNTGVMSSCIGMDQTKFFRIRSGQSRPKDVRAFCTDIGRYIFTRLSDDAALDTLSDILGCTPSELSDEEAVCRRITGFLMGDASSPRAYAESFLSELDRFDTDDYVSAADSSSYYFSSEEEKDFIASLENAPADTSAIICTDLYSGGLEEDRLMQNLEYIIAVLIRKGVHIDFVLNADNPMDEILPGLVSLSPVFLSGRISVYYLKGRRDGIFRYRLISLENAALSCEALTGHYDDAVTRVAATDEEIRLYRLRAEQLLGFASPLIEVIDSSEKRLSRLSLSADIPGKRVSVLSTPPFFTMSSPLLHRILERNGIGRDEAASIEQYIHAERSRVETVLRHSEYVCIYPDIPRNRYDEMPVFLSVSGLFYNREILCTYDEYAEHIRLMKQFEETYPRFRCIADKNSHFRNVQIFMHSGQGVMLSKNRTPVIHLLVTHSKLRPALENILSPYGEYM